MARSDPQEMIAAGLSAAFLVGFILMFGWLLYQVWTDVRAMPPFTRTGEFTNITTTMVGLVGGIAAARMGTRAGRRGGGFEGTFGWFYVMAYFILGMGALITVATQATGKDANFIPEAVTNLGTVSFGLMIATVGSYLGSRR
jgi:hypothetical protein